MTPLLPKLKDKRAAFYAFDVTQPTIAFELLDYLHFINSLPKEQDAAAVAALREVADRFLFSKANNLNYTCPKIFFDGSRREGWTSCTDSVQDQYRLAVLMLIAIDSLHRDDPADYVEIKTSLRQWLNIDYAICFETRTADLATLFFGPTWTALYSAELTSQRSLADAILTTQPPFAHSVQLHKKGALPEATLPDDLTP